MGIGKIARKFKKVVGYSESMDVSEDDLKLLERIRKNVEIDADATEEQREMELDDLRFCNPETQWSDADRASRESAGRPVLTEDRLGPFLAQVCNEQRKNKPGVQITPVDSTGDVETAEVIQGLVRHIEYNSNADTAYDTAFESAVRVGRGFYRICTDYVDDESLLQEIRIRRVENLHSVFIDPSAQEADYSDAKWGGFKSWMSEEDFKEAWPDSKVANIGTDAWKSIGDDAPDWMSADGSACMVVEYFEKEFKSEKLDNGRTVQRQTVKWYKATAVEVLERGDWASKYIPIVPVLGKCVVVNGQRTYQGLIRAGKDPQKRHNYLLTAQTERIAFMPISTWVGAKGFMGKEKRLWKNAHKEPMAALEFEIIGDDGQGINAPRMITEEAPIMAVTRAMEGAEMGLKGVLGMYDANMGQRQGSESGRAIERLQTQGETGNFHFQDNLSRALRYEGRIILDLLPSVYDTEQVIRIIGEDGTNDLVKINGPIARPEDAPGNKRNAIGKIFDLTTGKYDVTVSSGPSYQSRRQEDRAMLLGMLQGPMGQAIATGAPDLVVSTLDSPIARMLQERMKKMLPPQLQEQEGEQEIPPQIKAHLDQMSQQHEAMTQEIHRLMDQLELAKHDHEFEMAKAQLDSQTRVAIAEMNNQTELIKIQATTNPANADAAITEKLPQMEQSIGELEELVLAMHEGITAQPMPEPAEPQEDPIHTILRGHTEALSNIGTALHRLGGPKKIVLDPTTGKPIGVAPADEPEVA